MPSRTVKIPARAGGTFDCYLSLPQGGGPAPAMMLASAVHGVTADIRAIADAFAAKGFVAAAPDLFWRTLPGPLSHDDKRASERAQPRLEKIKENEPDLADTLAALRKLPECNGRAAVMGLCYGGPYAAIGPRRLGFDAGISCHGSRMDAYVGEFEGVTQPVCLLWGDEDAAAPPEVLDAYRALAARQRNVTLEIFPGVGHGYMMPAAKAFDATARDASMARAFAIMDGLRDAASIRAAAR